MAKYRRNLPQNTGKICITDGGLETDLVFHKQIALPEFASYDLLKSDEGYTTLLDYFMEYAELAKQYKVGLILETPTWRANSDWGAKIGDSQESLVQINLTSVKLIEEVRHQFENEHTPIIISGCIGPRGDGYQPDFFMSISEAQRYHQLQIETFAQSNADMVAALTINYIDEAIGITLAAQQVNLPVCISFTVETDGKLPTGETLAEAIDAVDQASQTEPVYYMINCAHPTHFLNVLKEDICKKRLRGLRANASTCSHAELDEAEHLDEGNPEELGKQFSTIRRQYPFVNIIGGCCGTDIRHIRQITEYCSK